MEEPTRNVPVEEPSSEETLGRRQLLKVLAATTGAVAASSMLPGEWAKPVVEAGVLPAHAQVTPTPEPTDTPVPDTPVPLVYSVICDSNPGGGDLTLREGSIREIQPLLQVLSGTGPVENITATMTASAIAGSLPDFDPPMPQTTTTDASGRAMFNDLVASGQPGQQFVLVFDFDVPSGIGHADCGIFFFSEL
jgi:hypothetical protein